MQKEWKLYRITFLLIIVNIVIYLFSAFQSQSLIEMELEPLVHMGALYGPFTVLKEEWWRLFTAMFLHGGMTHLLMNMFSLYIVGRAVETYFNAQSYLSIYLFSGLIGGLVSLYIHPVSVGVGASGAIFGVFGALAGFFLAHRDKIASHSKAFMKDFAIIIGINLVIGFAIPAIDVSAHLGGLLVGFIGGFLLSKNPKLILIYSIAMVLVILAIGSTLPFQYDKMLF